MSNDVRSTLIAKLTKSLSRQTVSLATDSGKGVLFNFGQCAVNIADVLMPFWNQYGRMPALIFNDGIPPSAAAQLKSNPNWSRGVWFHDWSTAVPGADGGDDWYSGSLPVASVNVKTNSTAQYQTYGDYLTYENRPTVDDSGTQLIYTKSIPNQWALSRFSYSANFAMPLSAVEYGAAATWAVLLLAYSNPETLFATDEGIMILPAGIAIIEKSLAYYADKYIGPGVFTLNMVSLSSFFGNGPVLFGVPQIVIDQLYSQWRARKDASDGFAPFFMEIVTFVFSAIALYAGAAGAAGLLGGAYTIPNLSASLSLASKVGVDTGQLSTALKLINLTPDVFTLNNDVTGGFMWDEIDFTDDWGVNLDAPVDLPSDWMGTIDEADFTQAFADMTDWGVDMGALESDAITQMMNDVGPISADQFATTVSAPPQVAQAAATALKAAGAGSSTPATAQQVASATQSAKAMADSTTGTEKSMWSAASGLLQQYAQYELQARAVTSRQTMTPTATNPMVRQPDGSYTVRNSDGTLTTVRPNGSMSSGLPSFMTPQNMMIGAMIGGALLLSARRRA